MTLNEAVEYAGKQLDVHIEKAKIEARDLKRGRGATAEELQNFLQRYELDLAEWRVKSLANIRDEIRHLWGETIH